MISDSIDPSIQTPAVDTNQLDDSSFKHEKLPSEFEVFISYRTTPDLGLAVALEGLIKGSIEPVPKIFVAGAGGLRPSKIGYKPQIQAAVQSSRAFISIITQQSKEREWLYYEAGAAWGRNQLFVPLLIGTTLSDLASTMADYQTVRASKQNEVENLLIEVAEAVGGRCKSHFSQRYRAFSKRVESHQKVEIAEENKDDVSPLVQAINFLQRGELEEANTLFDQLEKTASCNEEKARVRIERLLSGGQKGRNPLKDLESLDPELRNTYPAQFWLGLFESRTAASISHYEECIHLAGGTSDATFITNWATLNLAGERFKLGEQEIALQLLRQAMVSEDREFRAEAIESWQGLDQKPHILEQLVILSTGLSDKPDSSTILIALTELALDNKWSPLLAYFAQRADKVDSEGTTANNLGRALYELELYSLAYLAYAKAAESGISVAKVNIASLHLRKPLPAAGLKLLQEHVGIFDAADTEYPYIIRAGLEQSVQNERKKADELYKQGSKLALMIGHFGWEAVRSKKFDPECKQIKLELGIAALDKSEPNCLKFVENDDKVCLELRHVGRTIELWQAANPDSATILYCFTEAGHMLELSLHLTEIGIEPILKKMKFSKENQQPSLDLVTETRVPVD